MDFLVIGFGEPKLPGINFLCEVNLKIKNKDIGNFYNVCNTIAPIDIPHKANYHCCSQGLQLAKTDNKSSPPVA